MAGDADPARPGVMPTRPGGCSARLASRTTSDRRVPRAALRGGGVDVAQQLRRRTAHDGSTRRASSSAVATAGDPFTAAELPRAMARRRRWVRRRPEVSRIASVSRPGPIGDPPLARFHEVAAHRVRAARYRYGARRGHPRRRRRPARPHQPDRGRCRVIERTSRLAGGRTAPVREPRRRRRRGRRGADRAR